MSASTKLSTAVKAVCFLAVSHPEPKSSIEIAKCINTNASKLRKILSMLVKNDIVESWQGTSGGFILKKSPSKLHVQEIYCAIEDRKAFHLDVSNNTGIKPKENGSGIDITSRLNEYFLDLFADIQVDIENKMRKITIESVLQSINKNNYLKQLK